MRGPFQKQNPYLDGEIIDTLLGRRSSISHTGTPPPLRHKSGVLWQQGGGNPIPKGRSREPGGEFSREVWERRKMRAGPCPAMAEEARTGEEGGGEGERRRRHLGIWMIWGIRVWMGKAKRIREIERERERALGEWIGFEGFVRSI